jgi:hypothetical protein
MRCLGSPLDDNSAGGDGADGNDGDDGEDNGGDGDGEEIGGADEVD